MMKFLALDVGDKRVGIATSDELGVGVWPQETFLREGSAQDIERLIAIIQSHAPQLLVVGLPFNMDGSEGAQARKVRQFVDQIQKAFEQKKLCIPIKWCDERLTSWEADNRLSERGVRRKNRKAQVDSMAACLILEDYLKENL